MPFRGEGWDEGRWPGERVEAVLYALQGEDHREKYKQHRAVYNEGERGMG